MTWILLIALGGLASCAPTSNGCAGWRLIKMAAPTVDYMAAHDPEALRDVIAHAEFGQSRGCW